MQSELERNTGTAPIDPKYRPAQLASTSVGSMPYLIDHILLFVPLSRLHDYLLVNKEWRDVIFRQSLTYQEHWRLGLDQYKSRPVYVNIHMLKTIVLQYPPPEPGEDAPRKHKFVFSCQTSESADSFGLQFPRGSSAVQGAHAHFHRHYRHPHHARDSRQTLKSEDYRSSAIVPNVLFRKSVYKTTSDGSHSSSSQPEHQVPSPEYQFQQRQPRRSQSYQQQEGGPAALSGEAKRYRSSVDQILQSQSLRAKDVRESSHDQLDDFSADDASRSPQGHFQLPPPHLQDPEQDYDGDADDDVEIVPCPFESQLDGSVSNESSPSSSPPSKYFKGGSESERIRNPKRSSHAFVAEDASHQARAATDPTRTSISNIGAGVKLPELQQIDEAEQQDDDEDDTNPYGEINTMRQDLEPPKKRATMSMGRYRRPTRSWSMTIQPFLFESAAVKAMIEASQEYMEEDNRSMMVERSESLRIVWNASTRQEFVWIITTSMMDRSNPGEVHDPRLSAIHN